MSVRRINTKTLKRECWKRGMSVTAFARKVKRTRAQLYRALENPGQHKPTYNRIMEALCETE